MTQPSACPLLDPSLFVLFYFILLFITIIIFSPDQKIQVTCHHRHEPRTMGPTHPRQSVGGTTGRSPSPHDSPTPRGRGKGRRAPGPTHHRQPVGGTTGRGQSPHDSPRSGSVRARARRSPRSHRPAMIVDHGRASGPTHPCRDTSISVH